MVNGNVNLIFHVEHVVQRMQLVVNGLFSQIYVHVGIGRDVE